MKNLLSYLLIILLLQISFTVAARDFYSVKSGNATNRATWNTSRTGDGAAPVNFNDPTDNFIIQQGSIITGSNNFSCKGSLIIETGGIYNTGNSGNITAVATVVTINDGGVLKLSPKTTLVAGFILIQGTLENLGGEIKFNSAPAAVTVVSNNRRQKLF
jgi:hypothetical protein